MTKFIALRYGIGGELCACTGADLYVQEYPLMTDTIESLSPWFYDFDLGPLGRIESKLPQEVRPIHTTRLQMVNTVLDDYFTSTRVEAISCLDIACHEGFYSIELAKRGVKRVLGIDVREESLRKARFVAKALGLTNAEFKEMNAEHINIYKTGRADVTLFLGLLYHLENPMLCLRNAASVTKDVCIVETQVIDDIEGETEWGARAWKRPYHGVLALIDETPEFDIGNPETGAKPLAICPSHKGLVTMLKHAGFPRVEFVDPPPDGYEQFVRGKRVMCVAYKER
jgi:tRNA (mo5U34)-methyltransferase